MSVEVVLGRSFFIDVQIHNEIHETVAIFDTKIMFTVVKNIHGRACHSSERLRAANLQMIIHQRLKSKKVLMFEGDK